MAWKTFRTLIDHHPNRDLFIVETHPGGGQYHCLTLVELPRFTQICSINLGGDSVRLQAPYGHSVASEGGTQALHVALALGDDPEALAKRVETDLGLPARGQPARTPQSLALAVIGTLLDRVALGSRVVELRNGWLDSSGDGGSGVQRWARTLPGVDQVPDHAHWTGHCRAAGRYWALDRQVGPTPPAVVVDVISGAVWRNGARVTGLSERFAAGVGVRQLAWELEQAVDGGSPE